MNFKRLIQSTVMAILVLCSISFSFMVWFNSNLNMVGFNIRFITSGGILPDTNGMSYPHPLDFSSGASLWTGKIIAWTDGYIPDTIHVLPNGSVQDTTLSTAGRVVFNFVPIVSSVKESAKPVHMETRGLNSRCCDLSGRAVSNRRINGLRVLIRDNKQQIILNH